ncbi:MAG: 1-deoxy-D-xylulose-5-phosphate reductoisomerase [Clostridia bacterium]|nr:1-deoxy-D-xylulose-5-phosphate reductoisomerase [Clostridia bacterium]
MIKSITLLGSNGSIGTQTLDIARKFNFKVNVITANQNIDLLEKQTREFMPELVCVYDEKYANEFKLRVSDMSVKVVSGIDGLCEAAAFEKSDIVVNSVVGMVGLKPTLEAIKAGKDIALANKETLVTGGELVMPAVKEKEVNLFPVDSEHSAIFQCLAAAPPSRKIHKIILTASGGPFFGYTKDMLTKVTVADALKHPNWSMGKKITIDSATMMNKGLEVIEAAHLFNVSADMIDVIVQRESLLHSAVEFDDGAIIAQIGTADMHVPIQYALTYPERYETQGERLSLARAAKITFYEPDYDTFVCLSTCIDAIKQGGLKPVAANGANEAAVALFLEGKISFLQIGELVKAATDAQNVGKITSVYDIDCADKAAREFVYSNI